MRVEVGIDEAGYGPTLGPLVLGLVAVRRGEQASDASLYQLLQGSVGRVAGPSTRLAVDDSKKVYAGSRGFQRLERSALVFARPDRGLPTTLEQLCEARARPAASRWPPWYAPQGREGPELPLEAGPIEEERSTLRDAFGHRDLEMVTATPVPVLEEAFNESVQRTGNKAASLLDFVAGLVREVPERFPEDEIVVRVDRLGGRRYYSDFLARLFPFRPIQIEREDAGHSEYRIEDGGRSVQISFETKADGRHFTVALASILAKYTRELFLRRLNRHFGRLVAGLAPTAGYPEDAARFLDDIAPVLADSDRRRLVRLR